MNLSMGQMAAGILFSGIGFVAFMYGRKTSSWKPAVIGAALMTMPFVIQETMPLCLVSAALTAGLYFFRD